MKKLKYLLNVFLASALIFACVEEIENNIDFKLPKMFLLKSMYWKNNYESYFTFV